MQTWVTLAAKHAALASGIGLGTIPAVGWDSLDGVAVGFLLAGAGFAAVNSSRRARSYPVRPGALAVPATAGPARPGGALNRFRHRVDGVLTGMLSDDSEHPHAPAPVLVALPSALEHPASGRPGPQDAEPAKRVGSWPYLTVVPGTSETDSAEGELAFWGPRPPAAASGDEGRGKRRAEVAEAAADQDRDTASTARSRDGRRQAPRHAAPPAGIGTTIGRRLASPRFTSRSATHAG